MESRFRDLLSEAMKIAEEYRADFGGALKPSLAVTAFRYKAGAKRPRKPKTAMKTARVGPKVEQPSAKPDPKVACLQKRLGTAKKKLEAAKAAVPNYRHGRFLGRILSFPDPALGFLGPPP